MAKVEGLTRLSARLENLVKKHRDAEASTSYQTPYAVIVHENLNARHPRGQAKFLEQPAREGRRDIAAAAREAGRRGEGSQGIVLAAARRLLELSQPLVPVDTGALKASGRAELTGGG